MSDSESDDVDATNDEIKNMGKSLAMLIEKFQIVMKRKFGNKKKKKSSSKLQSIQKIKSSFNFNLFGAN